jgi:hypothetical protein
MVHMIRQRLRDSSASDFSMPGGRINFAMLSNIWTEK